MKYFLDTEFHEYSKYFLEGDPYDPINLEVGVVELISIGIYCEDGREFYAICNEFDFDEAWDDEWLKENVLIPIYKECCFKHNYAQKYNPNYSIVKRIVLENSISRKAIKELLLDFITGKDIEIYTYCGATDWLNFYRLFGTKMLELPKHFPFQDIDLRQELHKQVREIAKLNNFPFKNVLQDIMNSSVYPTNLNKHNALNDAKWNYKLYKFLENEI